MDQNFWNDDEEFRDIPDESQLDEHGNTMSAPLVRVQTNRPVKQEPEEPIAEQNYDEVEDQMEVEETEEIEEDFSSILNDARLRLEQGRLYEMILNNDLFEGTDADPRAVKFVQKQIRLFAKEQMEIMLGMKQEKKQVDLTGITMAAFPFNDLEVEALKALASTATRGATRAPEAQQFTAASVPEVRQGIKPIKLKTSIKPSLKPNMEEKPKAVQPSKKLPTKPSAPVQRKPVSEKVERILAEEGVTMEEIDTTFDSKNPMDKMAASLSAEEVIKRNKTIKQRLRSQVKPNNITPMLPQEQINLMYEQRAQTAAVNPQFQQIMAALNNKVRK